MNSNTSARDELQQAINDITNAALAENAAREAMENDLNAGAVSAAPEMVAPEMVAPEAVAMDSVAPIAPEEAAAEAVVPEVATPEMQVPAEMAAEEASAVVEAPVAQVEEAAVEETTLAAEETGNDASSEAVAEEVSEEVTETPSGAVDMAAPAEEFSDGQNNVSDELSQLKAMALSDLRPIIDKVDLDPIKKFKTLKGIIEATGDKTCLNDAYNTAKLIEDENIRARALLHVIDLIDRLGA